MPAPQHGLATSPVLSAPVAIAFFLLTNLVFGFTVSGFWLSHQLTTNGNSVSALITHEWSATRWAEDVYIGYAYVDESGTQHNGSARIRGDSAGFYRVGDSVDVLVLPAHPNRSMLVDRSHVSLLERMSSHVATLTATALFCVFGWWLLVSRIRRRWQSLRSGTSTDAKRFEEPSDSTN